MALTHPQGKRTSDVSLREARPGKTAFGWASGLGKAAEATIKQVGKQNEKGFAH